MTSERVTLWRDPASFHEQMKIHSRKLCVSIFMIVTLTLPTKALTVDKTKVPAFKAEECREFRRQLVNHSLLSCYDRKHSRNLGIAAIALFWTGIPAIPVGIAAAWTGKRQSTPAVKELLRSGVTRENYEEINRLCAILLTTLPVEDATLDGRNNVASVLGAVAIVLATFVFVMQVCGALLTIRKLKGDVADLEVVEGVEDIASTRVGKRDEVDGSIGFSEEDLSTSHAYERVEMESL